MLYTPAQLSFLVDRGMRPDADDSLAEQFARTLDPHDAEQFVRIARADAAADAEPPADLTRGQDAPAAGDTTTPPAPAAGDVNRGETPAPAGTPAPAPSPTEAEINRIVEARLAAAAVERQARLDHIARQAGPDVPQDLVQRAMAEAWPADRVDREFLAAIRRRAPSVGFGDAPAGHVRTRDQSTQALQAGMLLRLGVDLQNPVFATNEAGAMLRRDHSRGAWLHQANQQIARGGQLNPEFERSMDAAHQYRDFSLVDFCRAALQSSGGTVPGDRADMIKRALSTATLQNVFSTSVNMQLLAGYLGFGDTTRDWTFEADVDNFKTQERGRLEKADGLALLARGKTEANHITFSDSKESYVIERYAGQFIVDERDIIDDSFGGISSHTPAELGEMAAEKRPELVYSILLGNPTMRDSVALFNAAHSNLAGSAALDATTLEAMRAAMAKQTENGRTIQTMMRFLIVPEALRFTAMRLVESVELLDTTASKIAGTYNPHRGLFQVISDPRLDNGIGALSGSGTTWYGAAQKSRHGIEVGYLRGSGRAPRIETFMLTGGTWGMGWKCNIDIGAKAIDWRGLAKRTA